VNRWLACVPLALVAVRAVAAPKGDADTRAMFDKHGRATAFADQFTEQHHWPRLVEGSSFRFTDRQNFDHRPGCVVVQFLITPEGKTDKFVIVDSQPKGMYDETVIEALKFWKFDAKEMHGWLGLREDFGFDAPTGSHLGAWKSDCAEFRVGASGSLAGDVERVTPYYPPPLAQAGIPGCATVGFSVTKDGLADDFEVIDFAPDNGKAFAQAALQAVSRWQMAPPGKAGERQYARFVFELTRGAKSTARECKVPDGKPAPLARPSGKYAP
jgi:TonB family protein